GNVAGPALSLFLPCRLPMPTRVIHGMRQPCMQHPCMHRPRMHRSRARPVPAGQGGVLTPTGRRCNDYHNPTMAQPMHIRRATPEDFQQIWPIFHEVVAAGETYAFPPETGREQAFELWMRKPRETYVAEEAGRILGTYFIKNNQD